MTARMIEVGEAESLIVANVPVATSESVSIEAAAGRILREQIVAERDQPPFDRVTMDGFALRSEWLEAGQRTFEIAGTGAAGQPRIALPETPACVEIMTGAMCPDGADVIVPVERTEVRDGGITIASDFDHARVDYVHRRGSDGRAGDTLLEPGARLRGPEMAILASSGNARVAVSSIPAIAVVSTGTELVAPGEKIEDHQIRSSNEIAIASQLAAAGLPGAKTARLPDQKQLLLDELSALHDDSDVLILSGGVSMGKFDFVPDVLDALGVSVVLHKIRQRPGLPMWFGVSGVGKPVFALPGNPVSTLVCLRRYVIPGIEASLLATPAEAEFVTLDTRVGFEPDLTWFLPVSMTDGETRSSVASPRPTNTSGDFVSLGGTSGFIELPRGRDEYPAGFVARLYRW